MPPKVLPISVVIPCALSSEALSPILLALARGTSLPCEILIIDAGLKIFDNQQSISNLLNSFDIAFKNIVKIIPQEKKQFPGSARNSGIKEATQPWLAFLDLNTIPEGDWLTDSYALIEQENAKIAFGLTRYVGDNSIKRLFIRSTFGEKAITTLPGTILHVSVLEDIGLFLPDIRAAEDTDWLLRAEQFGYFDRVLHTPILIYRSIPSNIYELSKKWFRNYRSCSPVVFHLESQKLIYFLVSNLLVIFFAFNWNDLMTNWEESSFPYFANITKLTLTALILSYGLIRGLLMPLNRGTKLSRLLPLQWIAIAIVCVVLDGSKLTAFIVALIRSRSIRRRFLSRCSSDKIQSKGF